MGLKRRDLHLNRNATAPCREPEVIWQNLVNAGWPARWADWYVQRLFTSWHHSRVNIERTRSHNGKYCVYRDGIVPMPDIAAIRHEQQEQEDAK